MEGGPGYQQSGPSAARWQLGSMLTRLVHMGVVLLGLLPTCLGAQVVRGEVLDSLGGRPLGSVMIVLLDSAGVEHGQDLSDALGRFVLRADGPGDFFMRTRVVGYRRWESLTFNLARGQTIVRRIDLVLVPIVLPELTVEAERTCVVRPEEGLAAATLWDEVRTALELTQLTIDERRYRFRTQLTTHEFNQYKVPISVETRQGVGYTAMGFGSASAEDLQRHGFVRSAWAGPVYFGPYAQVLVSDVFLDHHCFRVRRGDRGGAVGLTFEPVSRSDVPDVEGTLWVDSATMNLKSLDWGYTELSRWAKLGDPGGAMDFGRLPNGAWFIERWELRAPVGRVIIGRADTTYYGVKIREGRVTEVLTSAGELVVQLDSTGLVRDTVRR